MAAGRAGPHITETTTCSERTAHSGIWWRLAACASMARGWPKCFWAGVSGGGRCWVRTNVG